jgi:hypothetical protein
MNCTPWLPEPGRMESVALPSNARLAVRVVRRRYRGRRIAVDEQGSTEKMRP